MVAVFVNHVPRYYSDLDGWPKISITAEEFSMMVPNITRTAVGELIDTPLSTSEEICVGSGNIPCETNILRFFRLAHREGNWASGVVLIGPDGWHTMQYFPPTALSLFCAAKDNAPTEIQRMPVNFNHRISLKFHVELFLWHTFLYWYWKGILNPFVNGSNPYPPLINDNFFRNSELVELQEDLRWTLILTLIETLSLPWPNPGGNILLCVNGRQLALKGSESRYAILLNNVQT